MFPKGRVRYDWKGYYMMNKERLLTLAAHLRTGKMGHKIFNFAVLNTDDDDNHVNVCGTQGCAMGELPIVWPEKFDFRSFDMDKVQIWFDIDIYERFFLFYHRPKVIFATYNTLPEDATKEEVALHIEKFVENGGIY